MAWAGLNCSARASANQAEYVVELRSVCRVIERVFPNQELYVPKKAKKENCPS